MVCITDYFGITFIFYNYVKYTILKKTVYKRFFFTILAVLVTQGRNATLYDIEGKVYVYFLLLVTCITFRVLHLLILLCTCATVNLSYTTVN